MIVGICGKSRECQGVCHISPISDIIRVCLVISLAALGQTFMLQQVQNLYRLELFVGNDVELSVRGKLVFIGKGFDETVSKVPLK
jgi:hypothetical protein